MTARTTVNYLVLYSKKTFFYDETSVFTQNRDGKLAITQKYVCICLK